MKRFTVAMLLVLAASMVALVPPARGQDTPAAGAGAPRAFELRVYTADKGKLEALERRFREHTLALFEKHGMEVIGFWKPTADEGDPDTLVYLLAYPSQEARNQSWTAFGKDPEWQRVYAETNRDGNLVKKVESTRLDPTDYSPLR